MLSAWGDFSVLIYNPQEQAAELRRLMRSTHNQKTTVQLFLERRHKLQATLAQPQCDLPPLDPTQLCALYEAVLNLDNRTGEINYHLKHQLNASISHHTHLILPALWSMVNHRNGSLIAFVIYRLCRKDPKAYWSVVSSLGNILQKDEKNLQEVSCLTDLFLYGLAITQQQFASHIFPSYRPHLLALIPKYHSILLYSPYFLSIKSQKACASSFQQWMFEEQQVVAAEFERLSAHSAALQQTFINGRSDIAAEEQYVSEVQRWETRVFRFQKAAKVMEWDWNVSDMKLKSTFQLKKECETFRSFSLSEYEEALYGWNGDNLIGSRSLSKNDMLKWSEASDFMIRVSVCWQLEDCSNLAGYFLEQMNTQTNRQQLVETIINECSSKNNLPFVLKILQHIATCQPSLKEYCSTKVRKILQSKMNSKYLSIVCQMVKMGLSKESVLLDCLDRQIKYRNASTFDSVQSFLQGLGAIVYYRNLDTHIRINELFQRMQAGMRDKMTHFTMEHVFRLRGLQRFLITHSPSLHKAQTESMNTLDLNDETNYKYVLGQLKDMNDKGERQDVVEYIRNGVEGEQFLTSYYYGNLLQDLSDKQLNQLTRQTVIDVLRECFKSSQLQRGVKWGRFMGQLYSYQIISRRKLTEDLFSLLKEWTDDNSTIGGCVKAVTACLQTAKQYLKEGEQEKEKKEIIAVLLELRAIVVRTSQLILSPSEEVDLELARKSSLEPTILCEIADICEYFHVHLNKLSASQISNLRQLHLDGQNVYMYLDQMAKGTTIQEITISLQAESKPRYKEKDSSKKWKEKTIKYKEKDTPVTSTPNTPTQTSPVEPQSPKKKMRVIFRGQTGELKRVGSGQPPVPE